MSLWNANALSGTTSTASALIYNKKIPFDWDLSLSKKIRHVRELKNGQSMTIKELHNEITEVKQKLDLLLSMFANGSFSVPAKPQQKECDLSLNEWLYIYLENKKPLIKFTTYRDYVGQVRDYVAEGIGKHKLTDITTMQIEQHLNNIKLGRTRKAIYVLLKGAFEKAVIEDKLLKIVPLTDEMLKELKLFYYNGGDFKINFGNVFRSFSNVCKKAKIENVCIHSLRHTFATRCYEKRIPHEIISEWLGHSNLETTKRYIHHLLEYQQNNAKLLSNVFD